MAQQITLSPSTPKSNSAIYAALIVLAFLGCVAAVAFLAKDNGPSSPANGASSAIRVPNMQNVPPPSQKLDLEVE